MYLDLIGEHQFHILIRLILAVIFISGFTVLLIYMTRRTLKTFSDGIKKNERLEFMNFDGARLRRANDRRSRRGKNTRKSQKH